VPESARSVAETLRDTPEAAALLARWEATQRAARCIAPICNSLAAGFDPLTPGRCELRDAALWLIPASAAQSAKLRQAMPRMLSSLQAEAIKVYEIKFRVQPVVTPYPGQGSQGVSSSGEPWPSVGGHAISAVGELALTVKESPLKSAAEHLLATLRKRFQQRGTR
jgi:hypothetical protein